MFLQMDFCILVFVKKVLKTYIQRFGKGALHFG